jgi:hypothetical protein
MKLTKFVFQYIFELSVIYETSELHIDDYFFYLWM